MAKQRCIKINKNQTITDKMFTAKDGQIHDGKIKVEFTPNCVFAPAKEARSRFSKLLFWRVLKRPQSAIFFIEGAVKALTWQEVKAGLQVFWNMRESALFVNKAIALESMEFKHMKNWQFGILLLVNILSIALIWYRISSLFA